MDWRTIASADQLRCTRARDLRSCSSTRRSAEGHYESALQDLDYLMEQNPPGMDVVTLDRLRQSIRERLGK